MDATADAARQEADGVAADAQAGLSKSSVPARRRGDCANQSHPAGLGAVLCVRPLESLLRLHPRRGREEGSAPPGGGQAASPLRVEGVEESVVVWGPGALQIVPGRLFIQRVAAGPHSERSHNPRREPVQERVVREIRMLRAMRRELETGLRWLLHGHEEGNLGYSQGAAYGLPRQFPTLPGFRPARTWLKSHLATRQDLSTRPRYAATCCRDASTGWARAARRRARNDRPNCGVVRRWRRCAS